jgi:hypothetical protein
VRQGKSEIVDWEKESLKRMQWDKDNGYWQSHQSLEGGCRKCVYFDNFHCKIIPCLVNRVALFSGCKVLEKRLHEEE